VISANRKPAVVFLFVLLALATACGGGGDATAPAAPPDHTPTTYSLIVDGIPKTAPYSLATKQQVTVQIKFFNAAGEDLDAVEAEHFGGLTLNPASLGTVTRVSAHHYQFLLATSPTPVSGSLTVSFGHDEPADEVSFDPAPLELVVPGQN
jgi:hypothetical protein